VPDNRERVVMFLPHERIFLPCRATVTFLT
jgi:hypothetical protein